MKDQLLPCEKKPSFKERFYSQDSLLVKTLKYLRDFRKKKDKKK